MYSKEAEVWEWLLDRGEFPLKDYKEVPMPDNITILKCARYPDCNNYCVDEDWAKYGFCSAECDLLADGEYDNYEEERNAI